MAMTGHLLAQIEQIAIELVASIISEEKVTIHVPRYLRGRSSLSYRKITFNRRPSRHRFCLIVYLLAEIHRLHVFGGSCTVRGLYYRDTQMIRSQSYIDAAKLDVCHMLNTAPVQLGLLSASKGLIAGNVTFLMNNGDVLDCNEYSRALTLPTDFENVERIETCAEMVLIVEKESVFESLLSQQAFSTFGLRFILLTGKGYPDCSTRRIVHRLSVECQLPAYILVDADPFGIEIMLTYQRGSQAMFFSSYSLATPLLRWIGLHPSEMQSVSNAAASLTQFDNKKIVDLLARNNLSFAVRQELISLQHSQRKAEIESVIDFLSPYYIPTKINRNLFLT
ncbi:meiotic recombination protein W68 [Drosophila sulfurigaster albostrigata]|uniref:meiotic recombination protein W68 n=1 Tax=Drosophila sulfurigaster albostrigata TaxID=89887 RepID=UPI002D218720|nr:meiotic recombination protein W68 [Drosophila sulfurigaster albostrigata]